MIKKSKEKGCESSVWVSTYLQRKKILHDCNASRPSFSMICCTASGPEDEMGDGGSKSSLYRLVLIGRDEYQTNIAADRASRRQVLDRYRLLKIASGCSLKNGKNVV